MVPVTFFDAVICERHVRILFQVTLFYPSIVTIDISHLDQSVKVIILCSDYESYLEYFDRNYETSVWWVVTSSHD